MTGDWVLAAVMGATMVGRTAVEVVTKGRDCEYRQWVNIKNSQELKEDVADLYIFTTV